MEAVIRELEERKKRAQEIKQEEREIALAKAKRMEAMEGQAKYIEANIKERRRMEFEREIATKKQIEREKELEGRHRDVLIMREHERMLQERELQRDGVGSVETRTGSGTSQAKTNPRTKKCTLMTWFPRKCGPTSTRSPRGPAAYSARRTRRQKKRDAR